jgi:ADP-ribose pyrophosphatase YjhB (NUDIX family)
VTDTADLPPDDDFPHERPQPAGWLSPEAIAAARAQLPLVYVDAVPVRVDESGDVVAVGLLLRVSPKGAMTRALVSGRVMYHERIRDALLRHIEKDLGPVALPLVPPSPQPFTVAEYFPTPGITSYHDPRQHAVSLAYVVPISGDAQPQQSALDLAWLTPEQACSDEVQLEMHGGQGTLLRQAMAHVGRLP